MEDTSFIDLAKKIDKIKVDKRLKQYFVNVLYRIQKVFNELGLSTVRDFSAFFDETVFGKDKPLKILVSDYLIKKGCQGEYKKDKNTIHITKELFSKDNKIQGEFIEAIICHEFIHFLVTSKITSDFFRGRDVLNSKFLNEAYAQSLCEMIYPDVKMYIPQIKMLDFMNELFGIDKDFKEFICGFFPKIESKEWRSLLRKLENFHNNATFEECLSMKKAVQNKDYLEVQRKLLLLKAESINVDKYIEILKMLEHLPIQDDEYIDEYKKNIRKRLIAQLTFSSNNSYITNYYDSLLISLEKMVSTYNKVSGRFILTKKFKDGSVCSHDENGEAYVYTIYDTKPRREPDYDIKDFKEIEALRKKRNELYTKTLQDIDHYRNILTEKHNIRDFKVLERAICIPKLTRLVRYRIFSSNSYEKNIYLAFSPNGVTVVGDYIVTKSDEDTIEIKTGISKEDAIKTYFIDKVSLFWSNETLDKLKIEYLKSDEHIIDRIHGKTETLKCALNRRIEEYYDSLSDQEKETLWNTIKNDYRNERIIIRKAGNDVLVEAIVDGVLCSVEQISLYDNKGIGKYSRLINGIRLEKSKYKEDLDTRLASVLEEIKELEETILEHKRKGTLSESKEREITKRMRELDKDKKVLEKQLKAKKSNELKFDGQPEEIKPTKDEMEQNLKRLDEEYKRILASYQGKPNGESTVKNERIIELRRKYTEIYLERKKIKESEEQKQIELDKRTLSYLKRTLKVSFEIKALNGKYKSIEELIEEREKIKELIREKKDVDTQRYIEAVDRKYQRMIEFVSRQKPSDINIPTFKDIYDKYTRIKKSLIDSYDELEETNTRRKKVEERRKTQEDTLESDFLLDDLYSREEMLKKRVKSLKNIILDLLEDVDKTLTPLGKITKLDMEDLTDLEHAINFCETLSIPNEMHEKLMLVIKIRQEELNEPTPIGKIKQLLQ